MEPSQGRCKDHQFQESEGIRSLVFLWVCKRASQSTVVFCLWDSRAVSQYYKQKDWGSRSTFVPGEHSLKENPLVAMSKVLLPPLHIKLGLMKNFVKALHKNGAAFQHLSTVLPGLSVAKLKEERFHQDITKMKNNYQGKWKPGMMGDISWMLLRDILEAKYTGSSKKTLF